MPPRSRRKPVVALEHVEPAFQADGGEFVDAPIRSAANIAPISSFLTVENVASVNQPIHQSISQLELPKLELAAKKQTKTKRTTAEDDTNDPFDHSSHDDPINAIAKTDKPDKTSKSSVKKPASKSKKPEQSIKTSDISQLAVSRSLDRTAASPSEVSDATQSKLKPKSAPRKRSAPKSSKSDIVTDVTQATSAKSDAGDQTVVKKADKPEKPAKRQRKSKTNEISDHTSKSSSADRLEPALSSSNIISEQLKTVNLSPVINQAEDVPAEPKAAKKSSNKRSAVNDANEAHPKKQRKPSIKSATKTADSTSKPSVKTASSVSKPSAIKPTTIKRAPLVKPAAKKPAVTTTVTATKPVSVPKKTGPLLMTYKTGQPMSQVAKSIERKAPPQPKYRPEDDDIERPAFRLVNCLSMYEASKAASEVTRLIGASQQRTAKVGDIIGPMLEDQSVDGQPIVIGVAKIDERSNSTSNNAISYTGRFVQQVESASLGGLSLASTNETICFESSNIAFIEDPMFSNCRTVFPDFDPSMLSEAARNQPMKQPKRDKVTEKPKLTPSSFVSAQQILVERPVDKSTIQTEKEAIRAEKKSKQVVETSDDFFYEC